MKLGKIIHLFIACVLLVSTIGVEVNKHYSGGELFSIALFVEAESCCSNSCCCDHPVSDCTEEADYYRLIADYVIPDNLEITVPDFSDYNSFAIYAGYIDAGLYSNAIAENKALRIVKPPPNTIDIPVLFHSLII